MIDEKYKYNKLTLRFTDLCQNLPRLHPILTFSALKNRTSLKTDVFSTIIWSNINGMASLNINYELFFKEFCIICLFIIKTLNGFYKQ